MHSHVKTLIIIRETQALGYILPAPRHCPGVMLDYIESSLLSSSCLWAQWHTFVMESFPTVTPVLRSESFRDTHCLT